MKSLKFSARLVIGLVCLLPVIACGKRSDEKVLNLYIWSSYLAQNTIKDFEARFGTRVHVDLYESNEALLAKLKSERIGYDVIVPSDYMVEIMIREKLLAPIDKSKIPNLSNVESRFLNQTFDPGSQYSVPYNWGTTGIGYRTDKIKEKIESWAILWDEKYRDRIAMLDDMREDFAAALKFKGHSLNSTDPRQVAEAKDLLLRQKPLVKTYIPAGIPEILLSGDAWIIHAYSGQVAKAAAENPHIAYLLPKEGATIWVDNFAIPATALHKELAYTFINYMLEPRVAADVCQFTHYSTANREAKSLVSPELRSNTTLFPTEEQLKNCEFVKDLGDAVGMYDKYWTEIKAQ
jgi:spermidine/putrescine-binding protein